ncbi:MAG: adenylate/guanylate cyclase domain-containing protein [Casimicrobiaceae bacterium]
MQEQPTVKTFLFTDIEGSTRLWEHDPGRMRPALERHDALVCAAVEDHRGIVVKMIGDGMHAVFDDPLDAVGAVLQLQQALANPESTHGVALRVRCGLHAGVDQRRDNDYFGNAVNRAARIMSAAHGGQVLVSQAVALLISDRLPTGVALRDLGAVRLRDLKNLEHIYQVIHAELREHFPALRALEATPNNLPHQVTSFIGCEQALAEVTKCLAQTRLLTLVGVGGLGKTRLSLQVAAEVMGDYPDGVWFVDLAPLGEPQLVVQAVASVLGVKEDVGCPLIEALVRYVKDRNLLLILDNCEHLVRACAELAKQLLQSGSRLKILASSREHLHLAGETSYPVSALAVPDPLQRIPLPALTQYDAVQLFIVRAVAAQPAFEVTLENAAAVTSICQRLDGIPLALELAAARVRTLSVEKIAARLSDRFQLLTRGDQTALPRQQTLRASIDWSYELLSEAERALFRRLAVFAGSWTLEAAEAVAEGRDMQAGGALDPLTNLVEKSLVTLVPHGERYRLLETMRQYALERLNESGELEVVRTRHLEFYLALAERARPELGGPNQGAWLSRLDLERENILAAHSWCDRTEGGAELGFRLVYSVKLYWINRGFLGLGHRVTVEALARAGAHERSAARCRALFDAGQLGSFMGRYGEAQVYLQESLGIARELADTVRIAAVLQPLGMVSLGQGDLVGARTHLEEALTLARALGNKRELAAALNLLATLHRLEGAPDTAEPLYEDVVTLARELGDRESIAIGLLNLAMVSIGRGASDRACKMLAEVLDIADVTGSRQAGQSALEVAAGLGASREDWECAARFYGVAQAQMEQTGLQRDPADEAFLTPLIGRARETLGTAGFATAEKAGRALSYDAAIVEARAWLQHIGQAG